MVWGVRECDMRNERGLQRNDEVKLEGQKKVNKDRIKSGKGERIPLKKKIKD